MKIDYELSKRRNILPQEWDNGCYLCINRSNSNLVIIANSDDKLHLHTNHERWVGVLGADYFDDFYELIGKIKDFRVTDIELE